MKKIFLLGLFSFLFLYIAPSFIHVSAQQKKELSQPCAGNSECKSNYCSGGFNKTCQNPPSDATAKKLNQDCTIKPLGGGSDCGDGLVCSPETKKCINPNNKKLNQGCTIKPAGGGSDCEDGLICSPETKKCVNPNNKKLNQDCTIKPLGGGSDCEDGLICSPETKKCVKSGTKKLGQDCTIKPLGGGHDCEGDDLVCDLKTKKCVKKEKNKGESCTSLGFGQSDCKNGLICKDGKCAEMKEGEELKKLPPPPSPPCSQWTDGQCTSFRTALGDFETEPEPFMQRVFAILLSVSGGIALLLIIKAGYQLMVSQGKPETLQQAREQLTAAIVGLLFLIFSFVILQAIGVDILKIPNDAGNIGKTVAPPPKQTGGDPAAKTPLQKVGDALFGECNPKCTNGEVCVQNLSGSKCEKPALPAGQSAAEQVADTVLKECSPKCTNGDVCVKNASGSTCQKPALPAGKRAAQKIFENIFGGD